METDFLTETGQIAWSGITGRQLDYIKIPHDRGVRMILPDQIIRVEALSNYSKIFFSTGSHMTVAKVLQWFHLRLPEQMFTRVHRSHLVNKMFIDSIQGRKLNTIVLRNGETIVMSRRKKKTLLDG